MISAQIICDSVNPVGDRLTTWILKFPRFILSEFNTHRVISKNSSSSRAIPLERIIKDIQTNPAMPEFWGKNQKGMQAFEELGEKEKGRALVWWGSARNQAIDHALELHKLGVHKQIVNRLLEPWMHQTVLCTGTDWENFFALRAHEAAQPEFRKLAQLMLQLYNDHTPKSLNVNEWHIPFGDKYCDDLTLEQQIKICTARAARVSYNNFEGDINFDKDFALHDNLLESGHLSPFEHCASALPDSRRVGNFQGWLQYRKTLPNENRKDERVKHVNFKFNS